MIYLHLVCAILWNSGRGAVLILGCEADRTQLVRTGILPWISMIGCYRSKLFQRRLSDDLKKKTPIRMRLVRY